jgi:elongation factor 1-alpha
VPISGAYKIKGVGDVLAGRVEQGIVKPGDEVIFLPTHTTANPCVGKVFTVEMHHKRVDKAGPGDNVGMNIKVGRRRRLSACARCGVGGCGEGEE